MPGATPPIPGAPSPALNQANKQVAGGQFFGAGGPGGAQQAQGYNYGLQNLQQALNASNNTTSGQMMQLQQQLGQNQGSIQQNLASRGLGNSSVGATLGQAPLQTYNLAASQVQNQGALRQMQAYQNLAQGAMQGGQNISQLAQPYAQTNFTIDKMRQLQGPNQQYSPAIPSDFMQGQQNAPATADSGYANQLAQYNQTVAQLMRGQQAGLGNTPAYANPSNGAQPTSGGGGYQPTAMALMQQGQMLPALNPDTTGSAIDPSIAAAISAGGF